MSVGANIHDMDELRAIAARVQRVTADRRKRVKAGGFDALAHELEIGGRWPKYLTVEEALRWPKRSERPQRVAIRDRAGITETTTVMGMTDRQRRALVAVLRDPPGRSGRWA